jgi:hypothetical protein
MNTLLKKAKKKYLSRNNMDEKFFKKSYFWEFVLYCYCNCDPASYGKQIGKKLWYELNKVLKNIHVIADKENDGDFGLYFPQKTTDETYSRYRGNIYIPYYNNGRNFYDSCQHYIEPIRKNYEFKVSFSSRETGIFTLRNMKPHIKMTGGYILCLVDCDNDFECKFFLIDFKHIEENLSLTHMHGDKKLFEENNYKNVGCTFKKNSKFYNEILPNVNKLGGTGLNDLCLYLNKESDIMLKNYLKSDEYQMTIEKKNSGLFSKVFYFVDDYFFENYQMDYKNHCVI